jgi:hypothetical protein
LVVFIGLNGRELTALFGSTFRFNWIRHDTLPRHKAAYHEVEASIIFAKRAVLNVTSVNGGCRSCRPNAPFAELVSLSKSSVAVDYYAERSGNRWVNE